MISITAAKGFLEGFLWGLMVDLLLEETWHKELLYRMTIPLEGLRPAVISQDLAAELDDYLSFRHIFRNIYGFELKSTRLERLVDRFEDVSNRFKDEIVKFLHKMEKGRANN